ncbi:MAG: heparinase II/III family protein, partial [bacterium]
MRRKELIDSTGSRKAILYLPGGSDSTLVNKKIMNKIQLISILFWLCLFSAVFGQTYSSADFPHPSFADTEISRERLDELLEATERERNMSEDELVNFIEDKSMAYWVSCPNCEGGFQGGILSWKPDKPYQVYCKYCNMEFPNDQYPQDKVQEIRDGTGSLQRLHYYENNKDNQRHYFSAKARNGRFIHLLGASLTLAKLYTATNESQYARRAVLILNRMAEVYPRLLPHAGIPNDGGPSRFTDLSLPHEYYSGKIWDWWYAEIPWQCAEAYDIVYHSGELEKLSNELGINVKDRIENDLLRKSVEFVLEFSSLLSNAEISTMTSMIAVGRAIGEPAYIHEAIHRAKELLEWHFFRDGMWMEFCYYHIWVVNHYLRFMRSVQGYSDPADYRDPVYGTHFDNFDPETEFPQLTLAKNSFYKMYQPDGFFPSTGDTKYNDRNWFQPWFNDNDVTRPVMTGPSLKFSMDPLKKSSSGILPGAGYSWLGMGSGDDQIYAGLNFCETAGHVHYDGLNLSIWAFGHQLLPDLGYTHTRMRWWSWGTLAHNTVVVDGKMQRGNESYETGGDLLFYDVNDPHVHVVEAGNELRYNTDKNQLVDLYRRQLVTWDFGGSRPIIVDIFRVKGGKRHEWLAHGPVYEDFDASISVHLKHRHGTLLGEDKTYEQAVAFLDIDGRYDAEGAQNLAGDMNPRYGFIHNLYQGASNQYWKLTFSPKDNDSGPYLDLHMGGGQKR